MSPRRTFRALALAEAVTWTLLLAGMVLKHVFEVTEVGVRIGGDEASGVPMTGASNREQAGAGLDRLTADQRTRLMTLNSAYRDKFGFPFLLAVTGSTAPLIIDALERRLPRTVDEELLEALRQVSRIAAFRLHDCIRER